MREIKFRCFNKKISNKILTSKHNKVYFDGSVIVHDMDETDQKDMVLMQFTGLYDKQGKEIWEGDIFLIDKNPREVVWCYNMLEEISRHQEEIVVIGNVYENPELRMVQ